jgi:hypothetical protein
MRGTLFLINFQLNYPLHVNEKLCASRLFSRIRIMMHGSENVEIACLFCDRLFTPYFFFSSWHSNTLPHKNKFKYEFNSIRTFWYYMHIQVTECTINISHTSFSYYVYIKVCVLQHPGNTLPYVINRIQIRFVTQIFFSIHTNSSSHSSSVANFFFLWSP